MFCAAGPHWTAQISYEAVASLLRAGVVCAVLMCLYRISSEYNGPLAAADACIGEDRYDLVECADVLCCWSTLDCSEQLRGCVIAYTDASRLSSADVFVAYHHRV